MWFDRSVSTFPLFSTAEFTTVPDSAIEGEHRYKVQTFSFDRQSGVYRLIDAYITRKAYNVFGSPTPFSVLSKEQSILKARVDKAAHPPDINRKPSSGAACFRLGLLQVHRHDQQKGAVLCTGRVGHGSPAGEPKRQRLREKLVSAVARRQPRFRLRAFWWRAAWGTVRR